MPLRIRPIQPTRASASARAGVSAAVRARPVGVPRTSEPRRLPVIPEAADDLYRRLGEAVERVSERLQEDDNGKPLVFRDTMIANIRNLVDIVTRLNIFGDGDGHDADAQAQEGDGQGKNGASDAPPSHDPSGTGEVMDADARARDGGDSAEAMGTIVVLLDTSSSIYSYLETLASFWTEVREIAPQPAPCRVSTPMVYKRPSAAFSHAALETDMAQVHFRVSDERLAFIDRAASIRGVTRTEFVLRSSEAAAIETLNERPIIALDDEAWDAFTAALDAPVEPDPEVKERFARRPSWDR